MVDFVAIIFYFILFFMLFYAFNRPAANVTGKLAKSATSTASRMNSSSSSAIKQIFTLEELNQTIKSPKLTLVDYYATWCAPCKAISPVLEKLSQVYPNVQFRKIDVDESPDLAQEYGVTAMPTFIFFKDNDKLTNVVGANVKALQKNLEKYA